MTAIFLKISFGLLRNILMTVTDLRLCLRSMQQNSQMAITLPVVVRFSSFSYHRLTFANQSVARTSCFEFSESDPLELWAR